MHKHVQQITHTISINYNREVTPNSLTRVTAISRLSKTIIEANA